jgi:hypothetical protein
VDEYVTFTYPLDQINEAFHVMHEGKRYVPTIHSPICGLVLAIERDHAP